MTANDLIYKSIYIITEYYNNNLQPYFDNISEDVLWIGPAERQEIRGREQVISTFSAEVHGLSFTMGSIRAICISPIKTAHEVILQYEIYTHYPDGNTDLHNQRIHYSWYKKRYAQKAVLISAGRLLFFTSVTHGHTTAETPFIRYTIKV